MSYPTDKMRLYMRDYNAKRLAAGRCVSCGEPKEGPGTRCRGCAEIGRIKRASRQEAALAA